MRSSKLRARGLAGVLTVIALLVLGALAVQTFYCPCEGKTWSTAALAHPQGRLRLGSTVYPVTLTRVEDRQLLARAWRAREGKLGRPTDTPPQPGWWSFHAAYRD